MRIHFFAVLLLFVACAPTNIATVNSVPSNVVETKEAGDTLLKVYRSSPEQLFYQHETELDIQLDWSTETVIGKAKLLFQPYFYSTSKLSIDGRHFDIHKVSVYDVKDSIIPFKYHYDSAQLHFSFDTVFSRKDSFWVEIDYRAHPNKVINLKSKFDAITNEKGLYFINADGAQKSVPQQVWTQGETHSSSNWFPTIDQPNIKTSQALSITVDTNQVSLSNGNLEYSMERADGTRTDYWRQEAKHPPYLFVLVVGDFEVVADTNWNGKVVDYLMEPEFAPFAKEVFGHTPEMLTFFSDVLDYPYAWDKYSQVVVREFISGAMENTSASVFYDGLNMTHTDLIDDHQDAIIAHELVHQWFGDLVTCESWANLALNESFATYGEYLWNEYKYGREEADFHGMEYNSSYFSQARTEQFPIVRYHYHHQDDMFDRHSYEKGSAVLHMLRYYVGDEVFFEAIQRYIKKHAFKTTEMHDLRLIFEEVCGQDLNWFFNQWFFSEGHPILNVYYSTDSTQKNFTMEVYQKHSFEEGRFFKIPVDVDIHFDDKVVRERHWIDGGVTKINWTFDETPKWINFDAEKTILGEIEVNQSSQWWYEQYTRGNRFMDRFLAVVRASGEQYNDSLSNEVMRLALNDKSKFIREKAVATIDVTNENTRLIEQINGMFLKDPASYVRSEAVKKLLDLDCEYHDDFQGQIESDSSRLVRSSALQVLGRCHPKLAVEMAKGFEEDDDWQMEKAVLNVYSLFGSIDQYDYFIDMLEKYDNYKKVSALSFFSRFIRNIKDQTTLDAASSYTMNHIATGDKAYSNYLSTQILMALKLQYETLLKETNQESLKVTLQGQVELLDTKLKELSSSISELH